MRRYAVEVGGRTHVVDVEELTAERFHVRIAGHPVSYTHLTLPTTERV